MHAIRKKLQSRRGASLTFALLLFLVCAVIGSVVLTAGTVAAGRMSQVAEMDQRYYSVNSAARLLIDLLTDENTSVKVVKTASTAVTTEAPDYKYYLVKKSGTTETQTLEDDSIKYFVLDTAHQVMDKYKAREAAGESGGAGGEGGTETSNPARAISINFSETPEITADMNVAVEEIVYDDGGLLFKISNVVEDSAKNNGKYTLYVRFQTDKDELRELDNENNKETVTTTLKWKLGDVQILRKTATTEAPTGG